MQTQAALSPSGFGTNDVQIMAGNFEEFSFDDVVQVLGLSRQCLRLLIRRGDANFSEILLKAGQVLEARIPSSMDPERVFLMLDGTAVPGSGLTFAVYQTEPTGPFPVPRASLTDIVQRVRQTRPVPVVAANSDTTVRMVPTSRLTGATTDNAAPSSTHAKSTQSDGALPAVPSPTLPAVAAAMPPELLGKFLASDLRPIVREELASLLNQMQQQGQALYQLDGRLQGLPQLLSAELRLGLAQHEKAIAAAASARPRVEAPVQKQPSSLPWVVTGLAVVFACMALIAMIVTR
jgi:hypothetical protein